MSIHKPLAAAVLGLALSSGSAFAKPKDIVDTAVAAGSFKTLAAALGAADLVDALKGEGPFTVFAPTDEAFAKLPKGTVESLLKPENKDQLVDILTYHVVSGEVPAKVAVTLDEATALNKKKITVSKRDGGLFLNDSKVVKTDIHCSNGVIHVIDAVLLPPSPDQDHASSSARDLMSLAIARGAKLYNAGQHEACAAIYEVTAHALMAMPEDVVSDKQRRSLRRAVTKAGRTHSMSERAWAYRHVFDDMMVASR